MSIAQDFLAELNYELPATRTLLERVPDGKGTFKPHPKSSAMGHLAQLVARMPAMLTRIVKGIDLDLAEGPGYSFETTETLVREFDGNVQELKSTLASAGFRADVEAAAWRRGRGHRAPERCPAEHHQPSRSSPCAADRVSADE